MPTVMVAVCGLGLLASVLSAQQPPAPAGGGRGQATAPPPIGWPSPPVPDGPLSIDTALVRPIKIAIIKGLNQPWSMAFVPEGTGYAILVTERGGKLRIVRNGVLDPTPVAGLPADIQAAGLAGLMDVQLHPQFPDNKLVPDGERIADQRKHRVRATLVVDWRRLAIRRLYVYSRRSGPGESCHAQPDTGNDAGFVDCHLHLERRVRCFQLLAGGGNHTGWEPVLSRRASDESFGYRARSSDQWKHGLCPALVLLDWRLAV